VVVAALVASSCAGTSAEQVTADTVAPETTAAPVTTTAAPDCAAMLSSEAQAAQLLMVMVPEPPQARDLVASGLVGGFGLKGSQRSDVGDQIAETVADAPLPPIVAVDEEGGTVQRLRYSAGRLASAEDMAEGTPQEAAAAFSTHGAAMAALGITMDFAPVADVGEGGGLGTRTYGDDPATVSSFVVPITRALADAGVVPVVKHWPGLGGADADPHEDLPTLAPIDELRAADLVPFADAIAAGAPAIMVSHAEIPGLTEPGEPASLSRAAITDELRGRQGFGGVVVTDSLGMGAVVEEVPQDEAAERAVAAGADIALLSGTDPAEAAHRRLVDAIESGRIPAEQVEASVRRVLALKGVEGECLDAVSAYSTLAREAAEAATTTTGPGGTDGTGGTGGSQGSDPPGTYPPGDRATSTTVDSGINDG
jgi:beta-N-acetylhexosaminidase